LEFQVHFHALADRAVREALDAVEAARRTNGPTDTRPHLAHLQLIHPDDLPRFRSLDAVANVQPLWAAHETQMDELTIPFLGEPRWTWQYPFASLVRNGAMLAMGSDWSVSSPNPLEEIHVAVNRVMPPNYPYGANRGEVFLPEERLDLETAIAAFTIGSAFVNHLDRETGSIEVGKLADIVLWKPGFFGIRPELVIKGGFVAWAQMGDANASIPTPQPLRMRPMFGARGRAIGATSVAFISERAWHEGHVRALGLTKQFSIVRGCRGIGKRNMKLNDALPKMQIDPETYEVRADGVVLTCEPATTLPLTQRYCLF
jgi:hypothetical protein